MIDQPLLLEGLEVGWCQSFDDPLLETTVVRVQLGAHDLDCAQLRTVVGGARPYRPRPGRTPLSRDSVRHRGIRSNLPDRRRGTGIGAVADRRPVAPVRPLCLAPNYLRRMVHRSARRVVRRRMPRMGAVIDLVRARRYVTSDLAEQPDWQWWSLLDGDRSGVGLQDVAAHEDPHDGRSYAQCVNCVGRHSRHFSCLAALLRSSLDCEIHGGGHPGPRVEPGARAVLRRLHEQGWRLRGLTSVFPL